MGGAIDSIASIGGSVNRPYLFAHDRQRNFLHFISRTWEMSFAI